MNDLILYHGSRGGIDGTITPSSRVRCDFGQGFYMGTNPQQAKGLVVEDANPVFYELNFRLSEIPDDRILILSDEMWIYSILANRRKVSEFNDLGLARQYIELMNEYDVVIGPIADDRMNEAFRRFEGYSLTDAGLLACLRFIDYGQQVVAKTDLACSKIDIISFHDLYGQEAEMVRQYTDQNRGRSRGVVESMQVRYQRIGKYLNEIVEEHKAQEIQIEDDMER